jgi:Glycerol uptake facilitator and related permeases (Major Intrinsic Protein Family)
MRRSKKKEWRHDRPNEGEDFRLQRIKVPLIEEWRAVVWMIVAYCIGAFIGGVLVSIQFPPCH